MSCRSRSLGSPLMFISFICIVGLCWSALALAAQPDPSLPGNHLVIKEVAVEVVAGDPGETIFTIKGEAFDFVNLSDLMVTLGDFPNPLIIDPGATSTDVVATHPEALIPGDYLLSVFTGSGQSKHDEYDLTISPVGGPQGIQGPKGDDRPKGDEGPKGDDGAPGMIHFIEKTKTLTLTNANYHQKEYIVVPCDRNEGEEVVSAGFLGIPGETPITTLTVDRVANHAFIEFYVSSGSAPSHDVVGKAICAVQ